jgi:hypothetical protein
VLFPEEKLQLVVYASGTGDWTVPERLAVHYAGRNFRVLPGSLECVLDVEPVENMGPLNVQTLGKLFPELPTDQAPMLLQALDGFLRDVARRGVAAMSPPPFPLVDIDRYDDLKKGPPGWFVWRYEPGMRVGPGRLAMLWFSIGFPGVLVPFVFSWRRLTRRRNHQSAIQTLP